MKRLLTVLVLVVGVSLLAVPSVGIVSAAEVTPIDADHDLTTNESIDDYHVTGSTEAYLAFPDMTIRVHDSSEKSFTGHGLSNDYITVEYNEEVERTLRVYIPSEYATPYVDKSVDPLQDDAPRAEYDIVHGGDYLSVKVTVTDETTATYPVDKVSGWTFSSFSSRTDRVKDTIPGVGQDGPQDDDDWNYIDSTDFQDATARINTTEYDNLRIQYYDTDEENWETVPRSESQSDPVYRLVQQDDDNAIYVVSRVDEPPQVRFKGTGRTGVIQTWTQDVRSNVDAITDTVDSAIDRLFGY